MTPISQWARRHGISAAALAELPSVLTSGIPHLSTGATGSEAAGQQRIRIEAPRHGVRLWRNNVGATPASFRYQCSDCGHHHNDRKQPVRYGLANDSAAMNKMIKSSDLIGITPMTVTAQHVGSSVGVFTAIETKRPGWRYMSTPAEIAQQAFISLVIGCGGVAQFATDPADIWGVS